MRQALISFSLLSLFFCTNAHAGGNTTGTEPDPTGDVDEDGSVDGDTVSCPDGMIPIEDYCFPDPDATGDSHDSGGSGGGGDSGNGSGGKDDKVDIIDCALKIGAAGVGWFSCIGTTPVAGTGIGAAVPAVVCLGASLSSAAAAKTCTGS